METGWLGELLPRSVIPESRSKMSRHSRHGHNGHKIISVSSVAPCPIRPFSQHWDLPYILNPPAPHPPRRLTPMSLDFSPSNSQSLYPPTDPFHLHNNSDPSSPTSHHQLSSAHPFDHSKEPLDPPDHPNYDLFTNSTSPSAFSSHRYHTNASSSASLGPSYGINSEGLYSHSSFSDSVPSFTGSNNNPYDMINSLPSSYGSGKVSPLTPSDPVGGLHHSSGFPPSIGGGPKDFPQNFSELSDRRLPNIATSGAYQSDIMEDYTMGGINNNIPFTPPLQHFQDRIGRFPENRFNHSGPPPAVSSHVQSNHGSDILRGIAPNATHVPGYEDMPHFMSGNSHADLSIRMPTVDETLARMKLQGHSIMGASNDLQTFIRWFTHVVIHLMDN
jgi:recombining binding protein suppressor of hairless